MRSHIGNAMVVKNAALAMASLAESDEVSALKVFKDPGSGASEADAGNDVIAASSAPSAKLSASESDDVLTVFGTAHYGLKQDKIETLNHTLSHERGSERSERCKRTSERTSEWPSTYVSILGSSEP